MGAIHTLPALVTHYCPSLRFVRSTASRIRVAPKAFCHPLWIEASLYKHGRCTCGDWWHAKENENYYFTSTTPKADTLVSFACACVGQHTVLIVHIVHIVGPFATCILATNATFPFPVLLSVSHGVASRCIAYSEHGVQCGTWHQRTRVAVVAGQG